LFCVGNDRQQLVDGGSSAGNGEQFEVAPLQTDPSASEKYVN